MFILGISVDSSFPPSECMKTMNMDQFTAKDVAAEKLTRVLVDRPEFHKGETEIQRPLDPSESCLPTGVAQRVSQTESTHYGVAGDVAHFLLSTVGPQWKTLEIGLGVSTLSIALKGAHHVCITPAESEIAAIRKYAESMDVDLSRVEFVAESSHTYLPRCNQSELDLVMIDGKHAFPFPIVDWFFTAEKLKTGGIMVIDDVEMKSVSMLTDFLDADPRWERIPVGSDKTYAYKKLSDTIHDVAWHMQPYVFNGTSKAVFTNATLVKRALRKIKRTVTG